MPAKKSPVTTPLHLLEQLSADLLSHFEKACGKALDKAEGLLGKLEKERTRSQEKLLKAQEKRTAALEAGKPKAQAKAEARMAELESVLSQLQGRQQQLLAYLAQLRRDTDRSLQLAKGVREVQEAARQAGAQADGELPSPAKKAPRRTPGNPKPPAASARPARSRVAAERSAKPVEAAPVKAKAPARKTGKTTESTSATAESGTKPAKAPARRPASRRKPDPQTTE